MRYSSIAIILTALLLTAGCAMNQVTTRKHPTLEDQLHHVNSVVVIPARVEIELVTLTGENERLLEEEEAIRSQLDAIARRELKAHGFDVVEFDFEDAMASNPDFAYTVTQIREGFDKAKEDLELGKPVPPEEANKLSISVGEAVNEVAAMTGADAILLMRYAGFSKSEGHVAKDVGTSILVGVLTAGALIPVSPMSGAMTEVALIDGMNGDVLWADVSGGSLDARVADVTMDTMPFDVDPPE